MGLSTQIMNRLMELEVLAIDVTPQAPPGSGKVLTVLGWVAWIIAAICIIAVMIVGARMALANRRGEGGEAAQSLGWVMGGLIIVSVSGAVTGFLLT